jgi:antirestriction protein ArdC
MNVYWDLCIIIDVYDNLPIMCVRWLESMVFKMSEFEASFQILMEAIEKHGTKKLIFKPSKTMIYLPDDQFFEGISIFQSGLSHSKIEKVARIYVDKSERDLICASSFQNLLNEMQLAIEFRSFDDHRSALAWLKE